MMALSYGYLTPSTGFTIEVMFKRTATNAYYDTLWSQFTQSTPTWSTVVGMNGRQMWFGCSPTTGALQLLAYRENGTGIVAWTDPSPSGYEDDGQWHHVAIRLATNKTTWTIMLDGEVLATVTGSAAADWKPGMLTFGGIYAPHLGVFGQNHLWTGALAFAAATNVPLTNNRIIEHRIAATGGTVYYGDDEVERLARIFDWTDTPVICRDTDDATSTLQGLEVAGTNALDALMDTCDWSRGYAFADGQSWIQYHNKRHRYNRFSLFTFAESSGSAVESGIEFVTDEEKIYNDIRGERPYGGSYRMTDATSIDQYGRRTYSFSVAITSAEELRNSVGWLLSRYGTEHLRVSGVSMKAESSAIIEAAATGRVEVGDHLVIDELPEWAPVSSIELTVEGISLNADFKSKTWEMSLNLTPAEFDRVFQIGVSALGGADKVAL